MRLIIQFASLLGALLSAVYLYKYGWDFTAGTTLLSFVTVFSGSFFLFKNKEETLSLTQKVGNNSTAYQSGRDMLIGEKHAGKD